MLDQYHCRLVIPVDHLLIFPLFRWLCWLCSGSCDLCSNFQASLLLLLLAFVEVFFFLLYDCLDAFLILPVSEGGPLRPDPLDWLNVGTSLERHCRKGRRTETSDLGFKLLTLLKMGHIVVSLGHRLRVLTVIIFCKGELMHDSPFIFCVVSLSRLHISHLLCRVAFRLRQPLAELYFKIRP